jgi:tyrosyl-tRNA synthetase
MVQEIKEVLENLSMGCEQILPKEEFAKKFESKKKLKIKFGMDPTAPDIHLGHAVVLEKLKQFQDLGHDIVFIIGDFTARIGDPSGKSKTRPPLTKEEVDKNSKTYFDQVGKILDIKKTTILYNSQWLSKLNLEDFIKIAGKITLARIIERDDFQKRLKEKASIGIHELFYPILQAYDSVELDCDIEVGGTDQTFNLLMGRYLQEHFGQEPQVIMTFPLLEGLDGKKKMSKSYGNYVGLTEEPSSAFGKLMSISDELMWRYYKLLLCKNDKEIKEMQSGVVSEKLHPMKLKKEMAFEIVKKFWSQKDAQKAQETFESLFQKHDYSKAKQIKLPKDFANPVWIVELLKELGAIKTSSEAKRLIESGAVSLDDEEVKDFKTNVSWKSGMIVKVGKHRIYKL